MSYPIIYDAGTVDFGHLGLGILKDATYCMVTEERNGRFQLNLSYPITGAHADQIKYDNVIKADAGHALKDQLFRIERIDKKVDGIIEVYAKHVSNLAQSLALRPEVNMISVTAGNALEIWRNAIIGSHPFTTRSTINVSRTTRLSLQNYQNAREVLGGIDGSILDTWGGEYRFDNYHVELLERRGGVANTLISYGRNLTDLSQEENISNTFTSVYPFAVYRHEDREEIVTLPEAERILDSQYANRFAHRRVLPVDFSREFDRDATPATIRSRLRALGIAFMTANGVGLPRVSMSVSFVDLTKSLNQAGLTYEQLNLCDTVPIRFEKLDIDTEAKIVKVVWNVLLDQYHSLDLGETRSTLSDRLRVVEREVNEVGSSSNAALTAANGRNTVFFGHFDPPGPPGSRVGDLWYRPNGEHTELLIWDGHGWEFIMSTAPDEALLERIREAEEGAQTAINSANNAIEAAREARQVADEAFDQMEPLLEKTNALTGQITTVTALTQGLRTDVTTLEDGLVATNSQITQLSDQINLAVSDVNGLRSEISVLSNQIDLRVEDLENEMTNFINVSIEGITLSGNRIRITGDTYIEDTVITRALIEELRTDQARVRELTVGLANVIYMNVDHLTGNTSRFIESTWNRLSNSIRITGLGLETHQNGVLRSRLRTSGLDIFHSGGAPAGQITWSYDASGARSGIQILARNESNTWLTSMRGRPSGSNPIIEASVDGTTGIVDMWGMRLRGNLDVNGQGLSGHTRFTGVGEVTINHDKALRVGSIGTVGYATNRDVHLTPQTVAGSGGLLIGDRRSSPRGGFFVGNDGAVGIRHRDGSTRLLDIEGRQARGGRFRIGEFHILWGTGTSPGVTGGGNRSTNWVFGSNFRNTPVIMVTPRSTSPSVISIGTSNASTSGFTVNVHRTNATDTIYDWVAIGPVAI